MGALALRVGVIGGLGFIGSFVVESLIKEGHEVIVLTRSIRGLWRLRELYMEKAFDLKIVDILNYPRLEKSLYGLDVVINLVALISHPKKGFTYKVNFMGSYNVFKACYQKNVGKVVHTSVAQVRFPKDKEVIRDLNFYAPESEYLRGKVGGELAAERFKKRGLDITIIRPSVVIGPRSPHGINALLLLSYIGANPVTFGNRDTMLNPVYVEDLAEAYKKSLETENGTFYIASDKATKLGDILDYTALRGSKMRTVIYVKSPKLAEVSMKVINNLASKLGLILPLPKERGVIDVLFRDNIYDPTEAKDKLGWKPKNTVYSGIEKTLNWFKEKKLNNPLNAIKFLLKS